MPVEDLSASELERLVAKQLGRRPGIGFEVIVACKYGWPVVLKNLPVDDCGNPNPNLYYLSCPWLRRRLARLEDSGMIGKLQRLLSSEEKLRMDLLRAQETHSEEYRLARQALLSGKVGRRVIPGTEKGKAEALIGGARKPELLKCLHAHLAFYLVHPDYLLGMRIKSAVGALECPDERCSDWVFKIRNETRHAMEEQGPI